MVFVFRTFAMLLESYIPLEVANFLIMAMVASWSQYSYKFCDVEDQVIMNIFTVSQLIGEFLTGI